MASVLRSRSSGAHDSAARTGPRLFSDRRKVSRKAMTEELEQLLKNLKTARRMLNVYDERVTSGGESTGVVASEFVAGLFAHAVASPVRRARSNGAFTERICRNAGRSRTFRWSHQPGVNRKQMRTFAELDFVAKHENLVLTGPTGVGKTGLALRSSAEGFAVQAIPLSVRARAGSVRRNVCRAGRPIHATVTEPAGASGRPPGRCASSGI